jgi:uncharacterized lipoprotein NlpE involved in copper resistance
MRFFPTKPLILLFSIAFFAVACDSQPAQDEANATEDEGQAQEIAERIEEVAFEGTLPCADCEGRQVTLRLKTEEPVFNMETIYVGKSDSVYTQDGTFDIQKGYEEDTEAMVYILNPKDADRRQVFLQTSENPNSLIQLDDNMKRLRTKLPNELIRETE